jgi:hypothetical protein
MSSSGMLRRVVLLGTDGSEGRAVLRFLVSSNVVPSSPILDTLMTKALRSSETSALTRGTWRNIPECDILRKKILVSF